MNYRRAIHRAWVLIAISLFVLPVVALRAEPITVDLHLGQSEKPSGFVEAYLAERYRFKKAKPDKSFTGTTWKNADKYLFVSTDKKITAVLDSDNSDAEMPDKVKINFAGDQNFDSAGILSIPVQLKKSGEAYYCNLTRMEVDLPVDGQKCKAFASGYITLQPKRNFASLYLGFLQAAWADVNINDKTQTICVGTLSPYVGFPVQQENHQLVALTVTTKHYGSMAPFCRVLFGQPMCINGKWFVLSVTDEGKKLTLTDYDGPMGKLAWPDNISMALLVRGNFDVRTSGNKMPDSILSFTSDDATDKAVLLPVGEYTYMGCVLKYRKPSASKDTYLTIRSDYQGKPKIIDITADGVAKICDESVKVAIAPDIKVSGRRVTMGGMVVTGLDKMQIDASSLVNKIAFYSAADDKLVHEGKLEYG